MTDSKQYSSERALAFLAGLIVVAYLGLSNATASKFDRRMYDFGVIRGAIESYKSTNGRYPLQGTSQLAIGVPDLAGPMELDTLVPKLLRVVPRDPQYHRELNRQYLYFSNGVDYKLIAHGAEDAINVSRKRPELMDPRRPLFAYGIWTPGAANW